MGKFIDISVKVNSTLPVWPGSPGLIITKLMDMNADAEANVSHISMEAHTGTHIDAPLHFIRDGKTTNEIPLEQLIGDCWVLHCPNIKVIDEIFLQEAGIPKGVTKLLLKTDNSKIWNEAPQPFYEDFSALSAAGAQYLVDMGIELVGIDYLSIQRYHDSIDTHTILLHNNVVILETINLSQVEAGAYKLICLPARIEGLEGCPVRAVLEKMD